MTTTASSSGQPGLSNAGLAARIAVFVFAGIPLLAFVWEALNDLIAGHPNAGRLLLAAPAAVLLILLWRLMAGAVQRWHEQLHAASHTDRQP